MLSSGSSYVFFGTLLQLCLQTSVSVKYFCDTQQLFQISQHFSRTKVVLYYSRKYFCLALLNAWQNQKQVFTFSA